MVNSQALSYWASAISQSIEPLEIPCDHLRLNSSDTRTTGSIEVRFTHSNALIDRIAAQCDVLPEVVCMATYSILLHRYTGKSLYRIGYVPGKSDSTTGTVSECRTCFPITVRIHPEDSARDHIQQLSQAFSIGEINTLQDFKAVVEALNAGATSDFISPIETALEVGHEPANPDSDKTLELFLSVTRQHESAALNVRYVKELFSQETIIRLIAHFEQLLEAMASAPDTQVSQLSMLGAAERAYVLTDLNASTCAYPASSTMMDLFMKQVLQCPEAIAVRGPDDKTLTYRELDESSNRLARYVNEKGIQNTDRIGVYLERGNTMMIALFGVMKSGASYVPLDPIFPTDRLNFMVQDASLKYVLTQSSLQESAPCSQTQTVLLDNLPELLQDQTSDSIQMSNALGEAYVIYTSGSTGVPKGVMIAHQALTNFLVSILDAPGEKADDRILSVTTLSFDISIIELFAPLLVGAQVVLASSEQTMSAQLLSIRIEDVDANFISATPSTWKMLLDYGWPGSTRMKALCGGEALTRDLADKLVGTCKELWNMYGPTETTVYSAIEKIEPGSGVITVGGPIANTTLYVLDKSMNLMPLGVPGELYIDGDGVATGYLNRDELTAERFVADPFQVVGARMYRSGDAARWLASGRLEVQGRLDDQVKLRGYRIEPGEIRERLIETHALSDAVVMVREDVADQAKLVAYLVPTPRADIPDSAHLRSVLKRTLPEYMVPDAWIVLEKLPQTPNGKIDRKQLPCRFRASCFQARN